MSSEEAAREELEAAEREAEALRRGEATGLSPSSRRSSTAAGGILASSTTLSSPPADAQAVVERAQQEARRTELDGVREADVPDRTRSVQPDGPVTGSSRRTSAPIHAEPTILPVVEEATEASSSTSSTRHDVPEDSDVLPAALLRPPQTPPKDGPFKPGSSDGGFAGLGLGNHHVRGHGPKFSDGSSKVKPRLSVESLNKDLPPLPRQAGMHG